MREKITIVFPCAGEAARFGYTFKPFLKLGDLTFIEKAVEPFEKWEHIIENYHFIFTRQQEERFSVTKTLKSIFAEKNISFEILEDKTDGPLQTFSKGFLISSVSKDRFIVCDCDHSINVDNLFYNIEHNPSADIIIPTWDIDPSTQHNWSKILLKNGDIYGFINKETANFENFEVRGIIGCIYFNNLSLFESMDETYADFYKILCFHLKNNKQIVLSKVKNAYFYGDVEMLEDCIEKRRNEMTIFCDIDGVLLEHYDHSTNNSELNNTLCDFSKLRDLSQKNHKIILTTARSNKNRKQLESLLLSKNIYYDQLITGLPSGPRILINDRKPSKVFTPQSNCLEVVRNNGLQNLNISRIIKNNKTKILKDISANSFAKTYLIEIGGNKRVRKHLIKNKNTKHYDILKRQVNDLERFDFFCENITPKILNIHDSDFEFYYDMEYLESYLMLSDIVSIDEKVKVVGDLLTDFNSNIYSLNKKVNGKDWLDKFLEEKIYPKFNNHRSMGKEFEVITESEELIINGQKYYGLKKCFEILRNNNLHPSRVCPVHGDLTLENIMYDPDTKNYKVIDMDGSRLFDARELDLGKLSQSIISNYADWKNINSDMLVTKVDVASKRFFCENLFFNLNNDKLVDSLIVYWTRILEQPYDVVLNKAFFYMSTYFIRFVPFRLRKGKKHGIFALLMAVVWLNKIIQGESE